jgi:hypothetical protein
MFQLFEAGLSGWRYYRWVLQKYPNMHHHTQCDSWYILVRDGLVTA